MSVGTHPTKIIDGQLHELGPRSTVEVNDLHVRRRIMLEVTLSAMDAVGVNGAVLFPIDQELSRLAVAEFPDRFRAVVTVNCDSEDIAEQIQDARDRRDVVGIRVLPGFPPTGENIVKLKTGVYEPAFAEAERHGIPLFLFISGSLSLVPPIVEAHPDLCVVIDHLGIRQPPMDVRDTPPMSALPELLHLARYSNVMVKLCGVPALSEAGYPYSDVWPYVRQIFEAFGPERLMWASDISRFQGRISWGGPMPFVAEGYVGQHSYADSLALFRDANQLSSHEKELFLAGNIRRILGWPR